LMEDLPPFDKQIRAVHAYEDLVRMGGGPVREFQAGAVQYDAGGAETTDGGSSLVMRSETFLELGSPAAGSCALLLFSPRASLVRDGRVTLVGPDIPEVPPGSVLPFGQVIVVGGEALSEADYLHLLEAQRLGGRIQGFMVKSTSGKVWCRVGRGLAAKGFDFAALGSTLRALVRQAIPAAEAVEMLFVTSARDDLRPLLEIEGEAAGIWHDIRARQWKERGIDITECAFGGHCGSCADRDVCDNVRKLSHTRKLLAEMNGGMP
jgi:CO dehydrogenase/acetyl-CoA synthase beta subunit